MKRIRRHQSTPDRLDAVFAALSDPTRRAMLAHLVQRECSVTALGEPFAMSAPAISRHLRVLETSGLIARRKAGRVHYCRVRMDELRHAAAWIEQQRAFWERQFDALASYLEAEES